MAFYSRWHSNQEWHSIGADTVFNNFSYSDIIQDRCAIIYCIACEAGILDSGYTNLVGGII